MNYGTCIARIDRGSAALLLSYADTCIIAAD